MNTNESTEKDAVSAESSVQIEQAVIGSNSEAPSLPIVQTADAHEAPQESEPVNEIISSSLERPAVVEVSDGQSIWGDNGELWLVVENDIKLSIPPEQVRTLATELVTLLDNHTKLLRFDECRPSPDDKFIIVGEQFDDNPLWFIGDLHGDLLALMVARYYIDRVDQDENPSILFLGDLFDRGKFDKEVLFQTLTLICKNPGRHAFVVGNHDEGLEFRDGKFSSSVHPCEFAEFLNAEPDESPWRELALAAIRFFAYAPRAILLPGGLLVAHGGVPHVDRQEKLKSASDLSDPFILEDFVWTRLHETAKRKIPNRMTRGCSLGTTDFNAFCQKITEILGIPVNGMIRGHDHLERRFGFFDRYQENPVLTINTISYRMDGEIFGDFHRPVIVARFVRDKMPEVHRISVPPELIQKAHRSVREVA